MEKAPHIPTDPDQPASALFGVQLERLPDNLLLEPIEYIFADHCRQRDMCRALKTLIQNDKPSDATTIAATAILGCLQNDLALHIEDEERDLFPLLHRRAKAKDKFDDTLRLLQAEHRRDCVLAGEVVEGLKYLVQGKPLPDPHRFRTTAELLSEIHLSHLNWENAVILKLARLRLSHADQCTMAKNMAARRGISWPH